MCQWKLEWLKYYSYERSLHKHILYRSVWALSKRFSSTTSKTFGFINTSVGFAWKFLWYIYFACNKAFLDHSVDSFAQTYPVYNKDPKVTPYLFAKMLGPHYQRSSWHKNAVTSQNPLAEGLRSGLTTTECIPTRTQLLVVSINPIQVTAVHHSLARDLPNYLMLLPNYCLIPGGK